MLKYLILLATAMRAGGSPVDELQQEYESTKNALAAHCDGFAIDNDPISVRLLDRRWSLIGDWTAGYLTRHPATDADELPAVLKQFDARLSVSAIQLTADTYALAAFDGELGTVFVVSRAGDRSRVLWSIKDAAVARDYKDETARWSARAATSGGLYGRVAKLVSSADGHPRFLLDATLSQRAGGTVGAQLSIWEWRGNTAIPVLLKLYAYSIDGRKMSFEGELLHVPAKGNFKTFSSCAGCPEPELDWKLRITPAEIVDLGQEPVVPELNRVDELFYRIQRRLSTDDLADPAVATLLKGIIPDVRKEAGAQNDYVYLGMLMDWKVQHGARYSKVCLSTDGIGRLLFVLDGERGNIAVGAADVTDGRFGASCADVVSAR